jgi:hypothetical protein
MKRKGRPRVEVRFRESMEKMPASGWRRSTAACSHIVASLCCVFLIVPAVCTVYAQSAAAPAQQETSGWRVVKVVAIDRTEPDTSGCREIAKTQQNYWRSAPDVFTDIGQWDLPEFSGFYIFPRDNDHMEISARGDVRADPMLLNRVEAIIQTFARPTREIYLVGWRNHNGARHSGQEFVDILRDDRSEGSILANGNFDDLRFNGHQFMHSLNFRGSTFIGASLCAVVANMGGDFTDADFTDASLAKSTFENALFVRAKLIDTDMTDTVLYGTDLAGANFEPSELPSAKSFALAKNIEQVTYGNNPAPLNLMKMKLEEAGSAEEARKVTFALNETEDARLLHSCRPPDKREIAWIIHGVTPFRTAKRTDCIKYYGRKLLFETTNSYGMNRAKPLVWLVVVWAVGCLLFWCFLQRDSKSGLSIQLSREFSDGKVRVRSWKLRRRRRPETSPGSGTGAIWKRVWFSVKDQVRLLSAVSFYSLTSITTFSFKEWDPGRWLNLVLARNYKLIGRGWVKRLAGVQALISLYLLVLLVLSLFSLPF